MSAESQPLIQTEPQPDPEAEAEAEAIVRRSETSFYWAMRTLGDEKRKGMFAVYAFCRVVDDIADEGGTPEAKRRDLARWRVEIDALYDGRPADIVARSLARPVAQFDLQKADMLAVIDGMEMDANEGLRIRDPQELALYNDRVACAVGRLSNRVFGVAPELGDRVAASLGNALQLTNILRDIVEDAERDRLYLPLSMLQDAGVPAPSVGEPLEPVLQHENLRRVCADLADQAEAHYQAADAALADCDAELMRPAIVMKCIYHRILELLVQRGWRRLDKPVALSKMEKFWIGMRHGLL